jgi:hypothetical protein
MKLKREPRYLAWIAERGCLVCGMPATCHHVRICGSSRDDARVLPLCPVHHLIQHGPRTSIEALGKRGFEERYGVDIEERVADYRRRYLARGR